MACPVESYARAVVAGEVAAGKMVRLACERHLRDLETAEARGFYWDPDRAQHAIEFFGFLTHSKGQWAGQPFTLGPWQAFIVGSLFGWRRRADGTRRFRQAYQEIPRKNGKSTLAAGVGLYLFSADGEVGAEVFSAATKRDQARIVHGEAVAMVKKSPSLKKRIDIFRDNLSIPALRSKYEPLGADADTMDGLNVHGAIIDELHAHKTRAVLDVLDTATGARRQPLIFIITTAGWDRTSVCWEQHQYAVEVLEGRNPDDTFFAYIATDDQGDDWTTPASWQKANPNYGISVNAEDLQRKCEKAKRLPAAQNAFRRLHLDHWTEQDERAIPAELWASCRATSDAAELLGQPCFAGLDLGSTSDLTALALLFRRIDEAQVLRWFVKCFFWVPESALQDERNPRRESYRAWARDGHLRVTQGNTTDYDVVRRDLRELSSIYAIREVAVDKLFQGAQLCTQLAGDGFEVIAFGQGFYSMAAPTKEFFELLVNQRLQHDGDPVLSWMAGNLAVEQDAAGNQKPSKKRSQNKIDGIVAVIMSLGRALVQNGQEAGIEIWG